MPSATKRTRHGITLVEVLVAMVILALFMVTLAPMLSASVLLRRQQELIAESTNLAQLEVEEVRRSWAILDAQGGTTASQNLGGLTPLYMRERAIPLPQPCKLSATEDPSCQQDPPVPPPLPSLPASSTYPYDSAGYEVTSPDPSGSGIDDLYLYDPNLEPPASEKIAHFTMRGVRGSQTYYTQVFWGYAPGSLTPAQASTNPRWYEKEVVRVVVRIYLAGPKGTLPVDTEGNPTRLTRASRVLINGQVRDLSDNSSKANDPTAPPVFSPLAPLVVLTADIPRRYQ